jgi:cytochrome c553
MRQRFAFGIAVLAIALLGSLAVIFAGMQNPPVSVTAAPASLASPRGPDADPARSPSSPRLPADAGLLAPAADSARGRMVFDSAGCARCHSAGGVGSPRYPLDGIGSRRTAAQLRAWTQGADVLADSLPPSALRTKQAYRALKPADLDALIAFLQSLKGR